MATIRQEIMSNFEDIKKKTLADFKERNKRLEDWFMSVKGKGNTNKGFLDLLETLTPPYYMVVTEEGQLLMSKKPFTFEGKQATPVPKITIIDIGNNDKQATDALIEKLKEEDDVTENIGNNGGVSLNHSHSIK